MILTTLIAAMVANTAPNGANATYSTSKAYDVEICEIPEEFRDGSPKPIMLVGDDKQLRYVIMGESWYADLTNRVGATERIVSIIRSDAEKTEAGRVKFHGKRVRVSENAAEMKRVYFYEDGWSFSEKYQKRVSSSPSGISPLSATKQTPTGVDLRVSTSQGYEELRKRRQKASKTAVRNEIHVGGK